MKGIPVQGELFGLFWQKPDPWRLRVNDVLRIDGRLGLVIRVNDCAAVVLMHRPARTFKTRFDKPVRFQQSPMTFRISTYSATEILNRSVGKQRRPAGRRPA